MEIVDPISNPIIQLRAGRPAKYDWGHWFKHNETTRLLAGKDFDCQPSSFRMQAYNAARSRRGTVKVQIGTDAAGRTVIDLTFQLSEAELKNPGSTYSVPELDRPSLPARRPAEELTADEIEALYRDTFPERFRPANLDDDDIELTVKERHRHSQADQDHVYQDEDGFHAQSNYMNEDLANLLKPKGPPA